MGTDENMRLGLRALVSDGLTTMPPESFKTLHRAILIEACRRRQGDSCHIAIVPRSISLHLCTCGACFDTYEEARVHVYRLPHNRDPLWNPFPGDVVMTESGEAWEVMGINSNGQVEARSRARKGASLTYGLGAWRNHFPKWKAARVIRYAEDRDE